ERVEAVPYPCGLRDELVTGVDQQLEVRGRHLRRDPREAPLAQRDARHRDGVSPVVLAGLASRTSLRGGERRRDVEDPLSRREELPAQRETEATRHLRWPPSARCPPLRSIAPGDRAPPRSNRP